MPTKIVYGIDALNDINLYVDNRKTLLVTSSGFVKRGLVDKITTLCPTIVYVHSEIKSHPEFIDLEASYQAIKDVDFDVILAIGGGSVLDAAKFLSVSANNNGQRCFSFVSDIVRGNIAKEGYELTPIISVPTTAGTGSEITPWATIWDMAEKKKYSLHLPDLYSEIALYDPSLTISVPHDITIQTGLDTLSHALESIWNKNASPVTIGFAIKSAKLIIETLPRLTKDLSNLDDRNKIMMACMYAGLAFSNTQTAIAHGLSYYITANKGVDHGIACSFTLPLLVDRIIGKYSFIDEALTEIFGELSSEKLRTMFKDLNISTNFIDYGINDEELEVLKSSLLNNQRADNSLVSI